MRNMIKGLILIGSLASFTAFAGSAESNLGNLIADSLGDQEDQLQICYLFNNDKVVEKAPCIYQSTYVSGGVLSSYTFNKHAFDMEDMADAPTKVNGRNAVYYQRDSRTFKKIRNNSKDQHLSCYAVKAKNIDLCVK